MLNVSRLILIVIVFVGPILSRASAQLPPQGTTSPNLIVGGKTVTCTSGGQLVAWIANYALNDVGHTGPSSFLLIQYNPKVLLGMPDHMKLFWLGHECGHAFQQTGDELAADCWSAKTGVKQGWFSLSDFDELANDMKSNFGDSTHPPGNERTANIKRCMEEASQSDGPGPPPTVTNPDPEASKCVSIDPIKHVKPTWNRDPSDPKADYQIWYQNDCDRPVLCSIKAATGTVPKDASEMEGWELKYSKNYNVALQPKESKSISGSLSWDMNHSPSVSWIVRGSNSGETGDLAIACKFTDNPPNSQ